MPTLAPVELEAHCVWAGFLADFPHFVCADGRLHRIDGGQSIFQLQDGTTCARPVGAAALLVGGEDGSVIIANHTGEGDTVFEGGGAWVNAVAAGPDGSISAAVGKTVHTRLKNGTIADARFERTVEDIAYFSKGLRFAAAHYNGVSLVMPATEGPAQVLPWAGAHVGITVAPGNDYVITAMLENALHGWRMSDKRDLRMAGYPAKTRSMSWSAKGKHLATSGAPVAVCWPFTGKDGPMGKAPLELGFRQGVLVTHVACHPTEEVTAIGYEDGAILLAQFSDGREVVLRRAHDSAVTTMNWDKAGLRLAFGTEAGEGGIIDIR